MDATPNAPVPAVNPPWWGAITLDEAQVRQWRIGPLRLVLWRSAGDLRIDV